MRRNQLVTAVLRIQVQQMILLGEYLAALIQRADSHAHIILFRLQRNLDDLLLAQPDAIELCQSGQERNNHRRRGRQAADGQRALHNAAKTHAQVVMPAQRPCRAAQVVRPVARGVLLHAADMPLCTLGELQAGKLHHAVLLRPIGNVHALINRQARDLAKLMVHVRAHRADAVGTEGESRREAVVDVVKMFLAGHNHFS